MVSGAFDAVFLSTPAFRKAFAKSVQSRTMLRFGGLILPVGHRAFADTVPARMLLWPTDGFMLTADQFEALAHASGRERQAYVVATEDTLELSATDECWRVSLDSYADYRWLADGRDPGAELPLVGVLENCICSPRGRWGVYVSQELWAIVGGSRRFITVLRSLLPAADDQVRDFIRAMETERVKGVADTSWVMPLLVHLYGQKKANQFIREAEE